MANSNTLKMVSYLNEFLGDGIVAAEDHGSGHRIVLLMKGRTVAMIPLMRDWETCLADEQTLRGMAYGLADIIQKNLMVNASKASTETRAGRRGLARICSLSAAEAIAAGTGSTVEKFINQGLLIRISSEIAIMVVDYDDEGSVTLTDHNHSMLTSTWRSLASRTAADSIANRQGPAVVNIGAPPTMLCSKSGDSIQSVLAHSYTKCFAALLRCKESEVGFMLNAERGIFSAFSIMKRIQGRAIRHTKESFTNVDVFRQRDNFMLECIGYMAHDGVIVLYAEG